MSAADNYRDTLIAIVEKSATLAERLSGEFVPINDPTEAEIIETRLKTWIQTAAQGDLERFRKRLEWDGLTLEEVKPLLGSVRRRDPDAPLPRWAELLGEVLQLGKEISKDNLHRHSRFELELPQYPFEEFLTPFRKVTLNYIAAHPQFKTYIRKRAYIHIQEKTMSLLADVSAQPLIVAFKTFQITEYDTLLNEKIPDRAQKYRRWAYKSPKHREHYRIFVRRLLEGDVKAFFVEYPVLARLMGTTIEHYIAAVSEFLDHLAIEYPLEKMGFVGQIGLISGLGLSLSDPHNEGRRVIDVGFYPYGREGIIYKPRVLGNEFALYELVSWYNKAGSSSLKAAKVKNRDNHGWMEEIRSVYKVDLIKNQAQLSQYYHHTGNLLALLQTLAANDCHHENVRNKGVYPVLIDAETLLHYRVPDIEYHFPDARATTHEIIENSVLRTQFLPKWEFSPNGNSFDLSTLGSFKFQRGELEKPTHFYGSNLNTDLMRLEYEKKYIVNVVNTIHEPQFPLDPNNYEAEIISGFTEMYRFLMAHREELLAEGSPLEGFKNQRVRYVFRPTQTYQTVLQHTLQPRYLHEGIDRSIQIESLNRVLLAWDEKPVYWDIHKGEAQAMEQMDVPLLTYNSSDTSLHIGDITIKNVFDRPAYTLVIERLNSMSEDDLQQQIAFIRGSLFCRIAHEIPDTENEIPAVLQNAPTLPRELLMSEAGQIADELQARAIRGEDGSATWITLTYHFAANRYQFGQISDGLYDGACGVAFFLAALHHVAGWPGAKTLALATIKPLQNRLYHPVLSQRLARNLGVNGPTGLKSIAYALHHVSAWLDEPHLLDDVRRVESLISPEREATEQKAGRIPENVFAQSTGRWRIENQLPGGVQLWGLYGGRAGVGYELLKMLDTSLPSIPF